MRTFVFAVIILSSVPLVTGHRAVPSHAAAPMRTTLVEARVNGVPLLTDRLDAAVNRLVPFESFHRGVKPEKIAALRAKALNDLIDEELEYQDGLRLGLRASRPEVEQALARVQQRFPDQRTFERRLSASGATMTDVRREIERSIIVEKTLNHVVTLRCDVSTEQASQFYAANPARFVLPEQLRVFAITIGVEPSAPQAAWVAARARLENVRRELQHGTPFGELARVHSTDPSRVAGGDMGFVHRGSLNDEFERALRGLHPGRTTGVVRTLYGFHLVRLAEIRPARRMSFPEVSVELRRNLTTQRCDEMKKAWIDRLRAGAAIVS